MLSRFSSLYAIVNPFIQICLLRQAPQDLPASGILLAITLTAQTVMSILLLGNASLGAVNAVVWGLLDTVLLVVLTGALLYVSRHIARITQTVTALAGTGAIITFIALPIYGWLHGVDQAAGEGGFALLLLLILAGWSLAVAGHIFRHALSLPSYFLGLALAMALYLISWFSTWAFKALFPLGA